MIKERVKECVRSDPKMLTGISSSFVFLGYEDDKVQLPFTVTDLKGRNLQLVTGPHNGQVGVVHVTVKSMENMYGSSSKE